MYADNVFGSDGVSSQEKAVGAALRVFYYASFIMSFMGVPLLYHGIGTPIGKSFFDEIVVISTQCAFVGSIYFPLALALRLLKRYPIDVSQAFCGFGSIMIAIVFLFVLMRYDTDARLYYGIFPLAMIVPPLLAWHSYQRARS